MAMPEAPVDQLTRAALEALLKGPDGWRHVVRDLAREAPDASPLALIFALVAAASTIVVSSPLRAESVTTTIVSTVTAEAPAVVTRSGGSVAARFSAPVAFGSEGEV